MLVALTNGKAGTAAGEIKAGTSWRDIFKSSEDLLTASVFGRLAYLRGPRLWSILRSAFGHDLPAFRLVELIDVSFWPTWPENEEGSKTVEPDVFLRFIAGDPEVRIDIIVEAKYRPGYGQYADQWRRQWKAYHNFVAEDEGATTYLLAVGGLGRHTGTTVRRLQEELFADGLEVKVVAADWSRLLDAVVEEFDTLDASEERRLLEDVVEAMALAGFRQIRQMKDLVPRNLNAGSKHIMRDYDYR